MSSPADKPDLGPLPKSHENAELQQRSVRALHSLLREEDKILLRDERIEDYGVDATFELKLAGLVTNFRAQVQLKGMHAVKPNRDGSISLSVRAANLNYLLNGTCPLYLLYDAGRKEFWYVWANEEERRLEAANPEWRKQEEVTLRFTERLDAGALSGIIDRILRAGRMLRQIHDTLARATASDQVTIRIKPSSLEITEPSQAWEILMASGPAIVASGYPEQALQLLALIDLQRRSAPRLQLTAGYAEYTVGRHYHALAHIRQALARSQELSSRDRAFLSKIKDASEFKAGIIDERTYQQRTEERARTLTGLESLEAQLEVLQYQSLRERDADERVALTEKTRDITQKILDHPEATECAKLAATLAFLYIQGTEANLELTNQSGLLRMRACVFSGHSKGPLEGYRQATRRLADWEETSAAALKKAYGLGHPVLIVEAHAVMLAILLTELMSQKFEALFYDKPFKVYEPTMSRVLEGFTSALAICRVNGAVEGRLRVSVLKMDFLELTGDLAGAKELAQKIYPEAEAMGFVSFAERARELLEERSLFTRLERDIMRLKQTDDDARLASDSDEDLQRFARDIVVSLGLPPARFSIVHQCCQTMREVARERYRWCRYLEVFEEQQRTFDPKTAFSVLPNQRCLCTKLGHETRIVTSDAKALIGAFKQMYCADCKDRDPKQACSG